MTLPTAVPLLVVRATNVTEHNDLKAYYDGRKDVIIVDDYLTPTTPTPAPSPAPTPAPSPNAVTVLDLVFGATITDATGKTVTNNGVVVTNGKANMSNGFLSIADHPDLNFGAGDFHITMDIELNVLTGGTHEFLMCKGTTLNNAWALWYEGLGTGKQTYWTTSNNNAIIPAANSIPDNASHRIEVVKVGTTTILLIDGVSKGTTTLTPVDSVGALLIGAWNYAAGYFMKGWLSKCTITKG